MFLSLKKMIICFSIAILKILKKFSEMREGKSIFSTNNGSPYGCFFKNFLKIFMELFLRIYMGCWKWKGHRWLSLQVIFLDYALPIDEDSTGKFSAKHLHLRQNIQEWAKVADHIPWNFLKAVFHKIQLIHAWILCRICRGMFRILSSIFDGVFFENSKCFWLLTVFTKKLHHRCLTGFRICFCL